jgi:hypothetical protein
MTQEVVEEDEGPDALVRFPQWRLRPSHLASPRASAPEASFSAGASTSRAAPVGSPLPRTTGWDDLEWGRLLEPPR